MIYIAIELLDCVHLASCQQLSRCNHTSFYDTVRLGWQQKISARARVKIKIENAHDEGLPRAYSKKVYEAKCSAVFEHVYQGYQGEGQSVYAA